MGYTHYWRQRKAFTKSEWTRIVAEAKRICAKAQRGLYYGQETEESGARGALSPDHRGIAGDFAEKGPYRIFPHPEKPTPAQGKPIRLANVDGTGVPQITEDLIGLNGVAPDEDYECFFLERTPNIREGESESFEFCKTEYRPYDAVVVSILHIARTIAPEKIKVSSDGGEGAIKLLF